MRNSASNINPDNKSPATESDQSRLGFFYALGAYLLWGILPLFFRAADHISAFELTLHRIIWAVPFALAVMFFLGRLGELPKLLVNWRIMRMMGITATLISVNWGIYVWAISVNLTSETALGYYINPLLTVLLGAVLLSEKLNKWQLLAVGLAFIGVLVRTIADGGLPWISLTLAFTFAAYGYLRKTVPVGPTQGFLLEVILLLPIAIAGAIYLEMRGEAHLFQSGIDTFWLMMCGPVTAVPLILYAYGAKRLRLATIGLMQYIGPSLIFLIAFFIFGEELGIWQAVTFGFIWTALIIYSWTTFRGSRRQSRSDATSLTD